MEDNVEKQAKKKAYKQAVTNLYEYEIPYLTRLMNKYQKRIINFLNFLKFFKNCILTSLLQCFSPYAYLCKAHEGYLTKK